MTLYTIEQVMEMLSMTDSIDIYGELLTHNDIISSQTPIELPTDDDIKNKMFRYNITDFGQMSAFQVGAKWVIDKIKNQQ